MKFLALAVVASLVAFAHGGALRVKNEDTRELIQMLERLLNKMSEKQQNDTAVEDIDPFEDLYKYLNENAADILHKPLLEVPEERIQALFDGVSDLLESHVDPQMAATVGLRYFSAFFEHVIYEGTEKIWEIADMISKEIEELREISEGASEKRDRSKRSLNDRKMKARELAVNARSAKDMNLSKKYFEEHAPKIDMRKRQEENDTGVSVEHSGYEYCHFSAVWEHIAGPAYGAIWNIRNITRGYDYKYYGNIFYQLQYAAETGILQGNVENAVYAYAYNLGTLMFTPPAEFPSDEVWARIIPVMMSIVDTFENFDGTAVPEVAELSQDEAAIFAQIYLAVGPLIKEAAVPLRRLLDGILAGEGEEIESSISDYIDRIFEKQLEVLANLAQIMRENMQLKADAFAIIDKALAKGRREDVFVAFFTEMTESAMQSGERLENMLWWFSDILDHVAEVVDPAKPKPEDAAQKVAEVIDAKPAGRKGSRKRFLKLMQS